MSQLLKVLEREVLAKAREEADRILREAEQEAERVLQKAREEAKRIIEEARRRAEERARRRAAEEAYRAKLEGMRMVAEARAKVLEELRKAAAEALSKLVEDEDRYVEVLARLVERGARELGERELTALVSRRDAERWDRLWPRVKEKLKENGTDVQVSLGGATDVSGGIVLMSKDGSVLCNFSFDAGLSRVFSENLGDLYKILWGEKREEG